MATEKQLNEINLDPARAEDQKQLYQFLGGRKFAEENMPYLHQLIQKEAGKRQGMKLRRHEKSDESWEALRAAIYLQAYYDETQERLYIYADAGIEGHPRFALTQIQLETKRNRQLAFKEAFIAQSRMDSEVYVDMAPEELEQLAYVSVMVFWHDMECGLYSKMCECRVSDIIKMGARVMDVKVLDPVKKTAAGNEIIIAFQRKSQYKLDTDYDFDSAEFADQNGMQPVCVPFRIQAVLAQGEVKAIDYAHSYMQLTASGGQKICNQQIDRNLKIEKDKGAVWITASRDISWGQKQGLEINGRLNKYNYKLMASIAFTTTDGKTGLVQVNSADVPQPYQGGFIRDIPLIRFYWGCLGKDSLVETSHGEMCKISQLQAGDAIKCGRTGKEGIVKDILTGLEEQVWRLETEDGRYILLTKEHPVLCRNGWTIPLDLQAGDEVYSVRDASYSRVRYLYPVEYHDTVYNLSLACAGEEIGFQADGFLVGDFRMQNEVRKEAEKEKEAERKNLELPDEVKEQLMRFTQTGASDDQKKDLFRH